MMYAVLGGIVGALAGYLLASKEALLALVVIVVFIPLAYLLDRFVAARAVKRGEVLADEVHVRVAEKAGLWALRESMITIALVLIFALWPTFFGIYVVPYEVVERLYLGLCLSFFILTVTYLAFYAYYVRSKKTIE